MGFTVLDLGTNDESSVDYPDFGRALAAAVADGRAKAGVAVCGTGIGISIAANREARVACRSGAQRGYGRNGPGS